MKNLGSLQVTTPTDTSIVMTRIFHAPRRLVFDAMSKPEFLKQWMLGPPGWKMTECEVDQRVGGTFKHAWRHDDGQEMSMRGEYVEVDPPARITRTETFVTGCSPQAGEQTATMDLEETGGKTYLTLTVKFASKEVRDGALASGMEHGVRAGYDRLEGLLAEMK